MFGCLPLLPIQLKTRPYYMEHPVGDGQFINGPKLTQAEILDCLKSVRNQLDEVHETTTKNISYAQEKQVKNYYACHIRELLGVGTKAMVKDKAGDVKKGDKLKMPFWGPYSICASQRHLCSQGQTWKRLVNKSCTSHLKVYMEHDHVFKIDAIDMPPVSYCNESSDEEMEDQSKGSNGKTLPDQPVPPTNPEEKMLHDLPVPAAPPKSPSQLSDVTSVQVPKSPSQLSTMSKLSTLLSVQVVWVQEGPKFQFLPLDDQRMWLCKCVQMQNGVQAGPA